MRRITLAFALLVATVVLVTPPALAANTDQRKVSVTTSIKHYNWSQMNLTQRIAAQHSLIVTDWKLYTIWHAQNKGVAEIWPVRFHYLHMKWTQRELAKSLKLQAKQQASRAATAPAVGYSGWDRVASCESGGNWGEVTGNGFYWGLQWVPSTWDAAAHRHGLPSFGWFMANHTYPSREQQILAASDMSLSNWPVCGSRY